ncbi:MAG: alpha-1,4-glucan--maltose-1-phosphate maltosyltransferase [Bacteroidales bacterium]
MNGQQRVIIENLRPNVNWGEFPAKRVIHDRVKVEADIFCDSHEILSAELLYKFSKDKNWQHASMKAGVNDLWKGEFNVSKLGIYQFTIQAWVDHFRTWHRDIRKRIDAATDYNSDLLVGAEIIKKTLKSLNNIEKEDSEFLENIVNELSAKTRKPENKISSILDNSLFEKMIKYPVKENVSRFHKKLEIEVERERANFSSWYEVFPRSLSADKSKHGNFRDVINFLPYVSDMGFDVLYLPPIHPIGEKNRKGKNNSTTAEPGDPGSPWAIGGKEGGHKAIHPELGTFDDFEALVNKAGEYGMEIAMDIAFQCSPDHPWIKEHPEWFRKRPDGSLQYAENPPKKYEDIYPLNFETEEWKSLWNELKSVILFWVEKGIKIFRVDNPHTKSLQFWGWVIREIRNDHADVIFLAEAFTRPKVMNQLAKQGFSQSYTYFTWRNTKYELTTYCKELVKTEARDFFRPNFWPNTPDILPEYLQIAPKSGFIQRLVLAATLSSNYGIYGPAFELMENSPVAPGKEEYLNSEKYEIKDWDFDSKNSLKKIISRVNKIRKENKALHNTHSLKFHDIDNEALLCYSKHTDDLSNIILVVVNLDPYHTHSGWIKIPLENFGIEDNLPFQVHDLIAGSFFLWNGEHNYVEIDPGIMPVHIFRLRRKVRSEKDFDYFM